MKLTRTRLLGCLSLLSLVSCIDEIGLDSTDFKKILVVESTLTNAYEQHEVRLSNTYPLDQTGPSYESNATVEIRDDQAQVYTFQALDSGRYVSDVAFAAQADRTYQLHIELTNGQQYTSSPTTLTSVTQLDQVRVDMESYEDEQQFVIKVDSYDPTGMAQYYRYEYEETYQIVAPYWSAYEASIVSDVAPFRVDSILKTRQDRVCYATRISNEIIQTETTSLAEDRVQQFPVRRLSVNDTKVGHRYSILVKQYVQSAEANAYLQSLQKFSQNGNLFSQIQAGFLKGNIQAVQGDNQVVGFFEVSSVQRKRLFFNYRDFIVDGRPPYFTECNPQAPLLIDPEGSSPLIAQINSGRFVFYKTNMMRNENAPGPYLMVDKACGDCTTYGSNIKPSFWVD